MIPKTFLRYSLIYNKQFNKDFSRKGLEKLKRDCKEKNIECFTKKDLRHNSVVLLVGDGFLYTQGQKPGQKVLLGTIGSDIQYFQIISRADHAERYYG